MTFTNPTKSISEMMSAIGQLNSLTSLLDPANGDERWKALQTWLKDNPKQKKVVEKAATLKPDEALVYLSDEIGFDINQLNLFDPQRQIRTKIETAIEELQKLYKARSEFGKDGRRIGSPSAKRKQKALARQPKSEPEILEGEIVDETLEKDRKL